MLASTSREPWGRDPANPDSAPWLNALRLDKHTDVPPIRVPPREFARVAPGIYASCLPHPRAIPFLEALNIRSALFFANKQHPLNLEVQPEVRKWITRLEEHKWSPIDKVKGYGKVAISHAGAKAALEYIIRAPKPLLLSGFDNVETCGLIVACLRKLQCWDMSSIEDELQRFLAVSIEAIHLRFVNNFCASIPPAYLEGLPEHIQRSYAHLMQTSSSSLDADAVLRLPSQDQPPAWLWCGHDTPASLLGMQEMRAATSKEIWHPTMHISTS